MAAVTIPAAAHMVMADITVTGEAANKPIVHNYAQVCIVMHGHPE